MTAANCNLVIPAGETWRFHVSLVDGLTAPVPVDLAGVSARFVVSAQLGQGHPLINLSAAPALEICNAHFTGSIAHQVLTVSAIADGHLAAGQAIFGADIPRDTQIVAQLDGVPGGIGHYALACDEALYVEPQPLQVAEIQLRLSVADIAGVDCSGMSRLTVQEWLGDDARGEPCHQAATGPTGYYELLLTDAQGDTTALLRGYACFPPGVPLQ